jgi:hypothetical protein
MERSDRLIIACNPGICLEALSKSEKYLADIASAQSEIRRSNYSIYLIQNPLIIRHANTYISQCKTRNRIQ